MVIQQRSDVIHVWDKGTLATMSNWPGWIVDAELDLALVHLGPGVNPSLLAHNLDLVELSDGTILRADFACVSLHSRGGRVLTLTGCGGPWEYHDARTEEVVQTPVPYREPGEVGGPFFLERGSGAVAGEYDAEGNFSTLETRDGVDVLGDAYGSLATLSTDGSLVAYVDHADPAAESHFVSPVVVVRDTATGEELGRWALDEPVTCLELSAVWLVACLGNPLDYPDGLQNQLAAIDLATGEVTTINTKTRLFLPA